MRVTANPRDHEEVIHPPAPKSYTVTHKRVNIEMSVTQARALMCVFNYVPICDAINEVMQEAGITGDFPEEVRRAIGNTGVSMYETVVGEVPAPGVKNCFEAVTQAIAVNFTRRPDWSES